MVRLADVRDYWTLRRWTENPLEVLRFRKQQSDGSELEVRFGSHAPHSPRPTLRLRGARADYHMFHRIFLRDEYHLHGLLQPGWTVVDLGGNIGMFTARVAPHVHRVVVAEPVPENFDRLTINTGGFDNVTALRVAVGDHDGTIPIYAPRSAKTTGVYSAHPAGNALLSDDSIEVDCITLDRLFEQESIDRCDLLKIDVEGAEYAILGSASPDTLARIRRIHGEYHDVEPATPENRIAGFESFLEHSGFQVEVHPHRKKPNHGMFFASRRMNE
ncbi:MAG: FkbM family methyltransferase [Planctomycetes bacterium]|nr:FkbM family methyltransferase [Planctomycetota bacterium]